MSYHTLVNTCKNLDTENVNQMRLLFSLRLFHTSKTFSDSPNSNPQNLFHSSKGLQEWNAKKTNNLTQKLLKKNHKARGS